MTTAATHVLNHGQGWEGEFGTWSDNHLDGLERMASAIARHGAIGLAQLFHGGMRAPKQLTGLQPMSASINELGGDLGQSRAMTEEDIREVIEGFEGCPLQLPPVVSEQASTGVELHGAHGYLLAQFLGAGTNRREDAWGGSQTKRTRLLAEIVSEVRLTTGPDFLVGVRLSPELRACGMSCRSQTPSKPCNCAATWSWTSFTFRAGTSGQRVNFKGKTCLTQHGSENTFQPMFRSSPPVAFGRRKKHWRL